MENKTIDKEGMIKFLNELLSIDPVTINALFSSRVSCNRKLSEHPTVQVGLAGKDHFYVGMIGIVNGLFGCDDKGIGFICAEYRDGMILNFRMTDQGETSDHSKEE